MVSPVVGIMTPADFFSPAQLVEHVQRLESIGHRSVWLPDIFGREVYVSAGFILNNTDKLKVASGVAHMYGRDPIASAQAARTLADFSGGRFIHGLGVSHPPAAEMRGLQWQDPVELARTHISGVRNVSILHTPAVPPEIPIFLAAHGPKMVAVAREVADGITSYMQTPNHTAESRRILGPDKELYVVLPSCVSTDPVAARAAGRMAISIYLPLPAYHRQWRKQGFDESDWSGNGSDRLVDTYTAWGTEEQVRARMQEHLDAGASGVLLSALNSRPELGWPWETLEALAPGEA
ncbi:MAG: LLM class flavin-dependent oxidoreductase [Ilumatobacteraceae bacterium]